jgi:integrase
MKGHIRKRGKSSWAIVLDLGRDGAGKRHQKWHTVRGTKKDAERELARLITEINTGDYVEPSRMLVREYLERWLRDYAEHSVSPKTYERYDEIIRSHIVPALGGYELSKLRPLHIQGFYTAAITSGRKDGNGGLSAQTVLHFHRLLHRALGQAVRWQLLARNPAEAVEPPRPQRTEMRALDDAQIALLLKSLEGSRLHAPVLLALSTGLRRGELLGLRWRDIDLERGCLTVNCSVEQTKQSLRFKIPKTERSRRMVALPSFAVDMLRAHKREQTEARLKLGPAYQNDDLIFPREDGSPWPPDSFSTAFAAFIRRSDLPHVRFHDLRHSHATQLLKHGVHPKIVSERLGHSKVGITLDTYSHVLPSMQEDAARKIDAALRDALAKHEDSS